MFHTTYKMYMVAVGLWTFGLFLLSIAWGMYGNSGWEEGPTEVTGMIFFKVTGIVFKITDRFLEATVMFFSYIYVLQSTDMFFKVTGLIFSYTMVFKVTMCSSELYAYFSRL